MVLDVVVCGGGIAGLAVATALSRKGHKVTLLEAASRFRPIGGIITLQANANRVLDSLGAFERLLKFRCPIARGPGVKSYKTGECLCRAPVERHEDEYGYPLLALHRADLHHALTEVAVEQGVITRLNCRVATVEDNGHCATVVLKSGERMNADVVVGADGIESAVRNSITLGHACVRDSGLEITRATIPASIVRAYPETSPFMDQIDLWCGPSTTIASMAIRHEGEWFLGLDCCHKGSYGLSAGQGRQQDIAQFRDYFKNFTPDIQKLLSFVEDARVWKLKEASPPTWTDGAGRIVLIGDAAHGSLPWVGQGGAMALEDAVTLAECLDRATDRRNIPKALRAFQEIRRPRCQRVQEWSARKGQRAMLADGLEQHARDVKLRSANAWIKADPWNKVHIDELPEFESPQWKAWLCGHDAIQFVS